MPLPILFLCVGFVHEDEHLSHSRAVNIAELSLSDLSDFKYIMLFEKFNYKRTMSF